MGHVGPMGCTPGLRGGNRLWADCQSRPQCTQAVEVKLPAAPHLPPSSWLEFREPPHSGDSTASSNSGL